LDDAVLEAATLHWLEIFGEAAMPPLEERVRFILEQLR
jgi:hypothetical protein